MTSDEQYSSPDWQSIHVYDTCIDSAGVNEIACLGFQGENRGVVMGWELLHGSEGVL